MSFIQWLCGLLPGHFFDYQTYHCFSCNVSEEELMNRRPWFKLIRSREQRDWDGGGTTVQKCYAIEIFGQRFGVERSPIVVNYENYMTRYVLYLGPINLRLHQFFRGDDDRASHTHPWWFITFPFADYVEEVYDRGRYAGPRVVRAFRFHYRKASHEHIVIGRWHPEWVGGPVLDKYARGTFWTFVIAGSRTQAWGFYPEPDKFVPWQEFNP